MTILASLLMMVAFAMVWADLAVMLLQGAPRIRAALFPAPPAVVQPSEPAASRALARA